MGSIPSHKDIFIPLNWAKSRAAPMARWLVNVPSPGDAADEPNDRKSAGTDESRHPPGRGAGAPARRDRRLALFHRPHPHALDRRARTARRTPAPPGNPAWSAPSRSIRAGQQALPGVETCSHLIVLYWMDRARRDLVVQVPTQYGAGRPTFSLRSPVRPNPIALGVVRAPQGRGQRGSRWSGSTASTAPRCSTSSPISPRPTPSPTPASAGTPTGRADRRHRPRRFRYSRMIKQTAVSTRRH